ncbi:MAG: S41 family peptidase [Bryobacterales bacterium]|nr:S41 family peptidase [Bryobacterales bacterium]
MGSRFKFSVICSSFLITILLVVGAVLGKSEEQEGAYRPLAVYTEILARIKSDYVEEPDIPKVTQGAIQGLVEYLDPVSSYLVPEQYAEYQAARESIDGGSGLSTGMIVRKQGAYTSVMAVLPNSPAAQAGIRADDLLDAIDNISTRVMPPAYLLSRLSGESGSSVTVMVRSSSDYDSPVEHTLVRVEPVLPDVQHRLRDDGIGYVDADVLGAEQVDQIADAFKDLEAQGADRLILDLRGNALGTPEDGIALANLLMDQGLITTLEGQGYSQEAIHASPGSKVTSLPIAVIVSRPTAGGAEIAAAAIQQSGRGEVVGESTAGLAALQEEIRLDDGAALILSVATYRGPNGEPVHKDGLEPDRPVSPRDLRRYRDVQRREFDSPEARREAVEEAGDPFLQKALEALGGTA